MTREQANKIKKILRKENAVFTSTAGYYDGNELRVKVSEYVITSYMSKEIYNPIPVHEKIREKETIIKIGKVLSVLSKNGLRPEYRTEQKVTSNALGSWDCRYVIFK